MGSRGRQDRSGQITGQHHEGIRIRGQADQSAGVRTMSSSPNGTGNGGVVSSMPLNGKRTKQMRLLISVLYSIAPLVIAGYQFYFTGTVDSAVLLIILIFVFASGYTIFGRQRFTQATEGARELTGQDQSDNEDSEE